MQSQRTIHVDLLDLSDGSRLNTKKRTIEPTGVVHKVRHARGWEGVRGVTVCDRGIGGQKHVTSRL